MVDLRGHQMVMAGEVSPIGLNLGSPTEEGVGDGLVGEGGDL